MGLFDRWQRPTPPPTGGHEGSVLPALAPDAADRLLALTRSELASRGLEATIDAGALQLSGGQVFGLHNLSVVAAGTRERRWPHVVASHLDALLNPPDTSGPPDPGQVLAQLRTRTEIPTQPAYPAQEPLPGVIAMIALDFPDHVVESVDLPDGIPDTATAMTLARSNLRELPPPEHQSYCPEEDDPTSRVHLFVTDDFFGAARLLVLDELLERAGVEVGPGGVLLCAPCRHVLVVHPLVGPGVLAALRWMVAFARGEHETQPGPVSPHVFHRAADGQVVQATQVDEAGQISVVAEDGLADALTEILGEPEDD